MSAGFQAKKQRILQQLAVPDQEYADASPKGSVDEGIRDLVEEINAFDGFVTTSSCAGRIAVFVEGSNLSTGPSTEVNASSKLASGKGGGKWLFVSHGPVDLEGHTERGSISRLCGLSGEGKVALPTSNANVRFVRFKYEPMILHIFTSSLPYAQQTLSAAQSAGFRESGISSISTASDVMVAVRTAGLMFDSIIAYVDEQDHIHPMVEEGYLRAMIEVANERFVVNAQRKERFRTGLTRLVLSDQESAGSKNGTDWEPADVRRERKRAEGMRRKEEVQRSKAISKDSLSSLRTDNEDLSDLPR